MYCFISFYRRTPMVARIVVSLLAGIAAGLVLWKLEQGGAAWSKTVLNVLAPFGNVMIGMLKMAVVPIIFFSLISGAASLPLRRFGRMGVLVIAWYLGSSLFAAVFGTAAAMIANPSMRNAGEFARGLLPQVEHMKMGGAQTGNALAALLTDLFQNPFAALAQGKFLPVIVFAILFGLAARAVCDAGSGAERTRMTLMLDVVDAIQKTTFRLIEWSLGYFPIGVFALTTVNFALFGSALFGPYMRIAGCVALGVLLMIGVIYPLALALFCRENPYRRLWQMRDPIVTAFVTRSSAAALPVSMITAERKLGVSNQLSAFALPLGATVNMDGVCIHLPVFALLAANMYGITMGPMQLLLLVVTVVLASVGAGGIPGGSIFLLFMVLENMGLTGAQVASIVALAIGINPLLDMFETACNVAGDNFGNYIVGRLGGMVTDSRENDAK